MTLQQLIQTYNQKLIELKRIIGDGHYSLGPIEYEQRVAELNQLKQEIDKLQHEAKPVKIFDKEDTSNFGSGNNSEFGSGNNSEFGSSRFGSSGVENFIGKNIMAIVASLLIFVSIIVLCGAVIPFINNWMKTALIFTVSTALMCTGIIILYKKNNAWSISITSCGLVSIYISTLASNIWLETLDTIGLYVLTLAWVLITILLSKKFSGIFEIICMAGIMISSIVNYIDIYNNLSESTIPSSTITLAIVGYTVLFISRKQKNSFFSIPKDIFATIFTICIMNTLYDILDIRVDKLTTIVCFVLVIGLAIAYDYIRHIDYNIHKADFAFTIISIINIINIMVQLSGIYTDLELADTIPGEIVLAIIVAINLGYTYFTVRAYKDTDAFDISKSIVALIPIAIWLISAYGQTKIIPFVGFLPIILILEYLGFRYRNIPLKIMGLISFISSNVVGNNRYTEAENLEVIWQIALSLITFIAIMIMIQYFKEQYTDWFKGITITSGLVGIVLIKLSSIGYLFNERITLRVIQYSIILIITLLMVYTPLKLNPITKVESKVLDIIFRVLAETTTYITLLHLLFSYNTQKIKVQAILLSLIIIGFSIINIKNKLDIRYREFNALYNIFKLTIVSWTVVMVLLHINPAISAISILISVIGIFVGFKNKLEYIRIYGLILSILSIIKISFIDIQLKGSLGTAICLFVCGMLCFCISFTYNKLDKVVGGNNIENINMH